MQPAAENSVESSIQLHVQIMLRKFWLLDPKIMHETPPTTHSEITVCMHRIGSQNETAHPPP
eukprot:COSAG01_NODE_5737_length_4067_cov_1380.006048_6_plen_62_part_00